jgi:CRISPR/Cas system CMR subunit Cmr4 (Cas7 group RAMP superfamily)
MREDNKNPVIKRVVIKADCKFASPALIGSGYGDNTDSDILRDGEGNPFLPGSTVAGVLRSLKCGFAPLFGEQDSISPLWVYDAELTDASVIELDGIAVDPENKTAIEHKKYDYEAISTGAGFTLRLLLTIRQSDGAGDREELLDELIGAIWSGAVAFGAKTKRGFGRVECVSAVKRAFDLYPGNTEALGQWINFDWNQSDGWAEAKGQAFTDGNSTIIAKLKLSGSIMIRDTRNIYEDLAGDEKAADYKHLSIGGKPVIMGTSWAGAFRSGLYRLLEQKFQDNAKTYLNNVFGNVTEDDSAANVSQVAFDMSVLEAKDPRTDGYRGITRVKINRFTGGAADGALFTEMPWYGGETTLCVRYPKAREDIKELILLGLEGINSGLLQIGGETAIGRGFLSVLSINGEESGKILGKPKRNLAAAVRKGDESV